MELQQVPLDQIKTSPLNPRQNFEGIDFDGLCESIAEHGVLQPIILRPVNGAFEIVAGERRYRAMVKYAETVALSLDAATIPATVKEMTDDEAFEIMTIENLQRKDLTDYEEAASFKAYVDRKGKDKSAIDELADRTGIRPGYIRGRVAIMELPQYIRKAWRKDKLKTGHLFQLLRINDASERKLTYEHLLSARWSVKDLKRHLDNRAPELGPAIFDKTECAACPHNSDEQKKLFAIDTDKAVCMKPACYTEKLRAKLTEIWEETDFVKKDKLTRFVFYDEVNPEDYTHMWHPLPVEECFGCESHAAVLTISDGGQYERGTEKCLNRTCAAAMEKRENAKARGERIKIEKDPNEPRVPWHGEYFREKFYKNRLPEVIEQVEPESDIATRLALYTILRKFPQLHLWFVEKTAALTAKTVKDMTDYERGYYRLNQVDLIDELRDLSKDTMQQLTVEALAKIAIDDDFDYADRQMIADHIGVNLLEEWRPDEEYLNKKTKAELIAIGQKFGVFEQPFAQQLLHDVYQKKSFEALKKFEMIAIFTNPEIKLEGVVPDEIVRGTIWEKLRAQASEKKAKKKGAK